jgi:hypothetical protein
MTDILNWLQSGSEVASAAISLGATTAAWRAASKSAKAATQSDQTAGAMLWLEKERRHDELNPINNGLSVKFEDTPNGSRYNMYCISVKVDRKYVIAFTPLSDGGEKNWISYKIKHDPEIVDRTRAIIKVHPKKVREFEHPIGNTVPHLVLWRVLLSFTPYTWSCNCSSPDRDPHWVYSAYVNDPRQASP